MFTVNDGFHGSITPCSLLCDSDPEVVSFIEDVVFAGPVFVCDDFVATDAVGKSTAFFGHACSDKDMEAGFGVRHISTSLVGARLLSASSSKSKL